MGETATAPELVPPVADETPAKPKRVKKPKKEPSVRRSKFNELYPDDAAITMLAESNPKKQGSKSRERFEGYTGASTVKEALANGVTYQDIAYDVGRNFVKIG